MTTRIDRRQLIQAAMFGLGALTIPGVASILHARGFTHGVASGEPRARSMLLWTRYASDSGARLRVEVATDTMFTRIVAGGDAFADPERDHTARVIVEGLAPGRWLFYRFIAPDGTISPVGRTRTLPEGDVSRFGIGLFSCSNLGFGWFNAYAHACERSDLELMVHVGDYLYEYPVGTYPDTRDILPGRLLQPSHEIVALADYRLRHACYRLDPDLQRLHQSYPMVTGWDDHEFTNDAWVDGAQNHQPDTEGDWTARKAAAMRAYRDWMPVSDPGPGGVEWGTYEIGSLATLFKLETRISGRSKLLELEEALKGRKDLERALTEFRDGPLTDPSRTMLGATQEAWLAAELVRSRRSGTRWQVLAQQTVMGERIMPPRALDWVPADAPDHLKRGARVGVAAAKLGMGYDFDAWSGFPAARARLLAAAQRADADLVVLSGDSHNGWAYDLAHDGRAAGIDIGTHSVTSPGIEKQVSRAAPAEVAAALRATNPALAWCDTSQRGYTSVQLRPDSMTADWHFMRTIAERDSALAGSHRMRAAHGRRVWDKA
jgi:alkaline phosphatase D